MSRPLRIAFVIAALERAGSEQQMLELAERLPRDRFQPEFLLLSRPGSNAERAIAAGIPIHVIRPEIRRAEATAPVVGARLGRKVGNYIRVARAGRYDVIDAWLFHAYVLATLTRHLVGVPVFVTGRRSLRPREASGRAGQALQRLAGHASDAIVANSPQVRDVVLARERVGPERVRVIRNGVVIPPPGTAALRNAIRSEIGLHATSFVVGMIANLRPAKGHDVLIRAAAILAQRRPTMTFVVVGDGPLRTELATLARGLGVEERIRFIGSVGNAARLLPAFDAVAHPSFGEGLPNSILEAAAAARPIVATPVGGTVEIIRDGETGLLVPVDDPTALADALNHLDEDRALGEALGAAARAWVQREFGMGRFVSTFADLYEELAARRGIAR